MSRTGNSSAISLTAIAFDGFAAWEERASPTHAAWTRANAFTAAPGTSCFIPSESGVLERVLVGVNVEDCLAAFAALPYVLPPGDYRVDALPQGCDAHLLALGFELGSYRFTRYCAARREPARLLPVTGVDADRLRREVDASCLVRDLVNTPTEDMGPDELEAVARALADTHGAEFRAVVGDALLEENFPSIHAVGRASHRAPRLLEIEWGDRAHPRLAIVGKGVCFDTGGLDLKGASGMRWMKKDMGGAAHALALGQMIMEARLPVRLQVLVPAVENAVAGNAFRPGDVLSTRAGLTIEIDNTDAEGRLVLADALTLAAESEPDLILDFATLTGAARVALGPDLPAIFSNRARLTATFAAMGTRHSDPVWPLPLWAGYRSMLDSPIADMANGSGSKHAGSIVAALYLSRFVPDSIDWCHVDVYSWNDSDRPGRPRGGEAQSLRAAFALVEDRYRPA